MLLLTVKIQERIGIADKIKEAGQQHLFKSTSYCRVVYSISTLHLISSDPCLLSLNQCRIFLNPSPLSSLHHKLPQHSIIPCSSSSIAV